MLLNLETGFFFNRNLFLLSHKWFIIPGDFMNKQFKQQVAWSMWAGYKIVAQKKYFKS